MKDINPEELVRDFVTNCDNSLRIGGIILQFMSMEYEDQKRFLSFVAAYIMGLKQKNKNE